MVDDECPKQEHPDHPGELPAAVQSSADCLLQPVVRHASPPLVGLSLSLAQLGTVSALECCSCGAAALQSFTHGLPAGIAGQAAGWGQPNNALAPHRRGTPAQAADEVLRFRARLLPEPGMTLAQHESMRR